MLPIKLPPKVQAYVAGKQCIDHVFYDTPSIASSNSSSSTAPLTLNVFDGSRAGNPMLTNVNKNQQMELNELAIIYGISVTPLAGLTHKSGAVGTVAAAADTLSDVDKIVRLTAFQFQIGTIPYPAISSHMLGCAGGVDLQASNSQAGAVADTLFLIGNANNGTPKHDNFRRLRSLIYWYGLKPLNGTLVYGTGNLSADTPVKIGLHCLYFRNYQAEEGVDPRQVR